MIIKIDKINDKDKKALSFTENYTIPESYLLDNNEVSASFEGDISLRDDVYKLKGILTAEVEVCCSLCLKPVPVSLEIDVLEFFVNVNTNVETISDVLSDDLEFISFSTLEIDTFLPLLTNILLHIPSKVYCDDDCKGLCPTCGVRLSESSCDCEKPIDPRLESLKSYFDN